MAGHAVSRHRTFVIDQPNIPVYGNIGVYYDHHKVKKIQCAGGKESRGALM
jgi:hypothetical protein